MGRYDGKTAVIIGGTSGMGLVTAKLLMEEGARVLVTGRSDASLAAARDALGAPVIVTRSDTASLSDIDALAALAASKLGKIDLLFVNAGVTRFVPFESMTEQDYDELFAINAKGPYFTVQKLTALINEGGSVVVTTSIANVLGYPMIGAYSASKAALRSMVRSIARELLPRGIRVNAVSPGPTDTGILDKSMPAEAAAETKKFMSDDNPMKRFGRSEEVAKAVIFLAFEATYTTGAELVVDGGQSQL
jgi:NAD(P)-dependent dehydrogenase (short-subunit alcohol dehydrogenase family)